MKKLNVILLSGICLCCMHHYCSGSAFTAETPGNDSCSKSIAVGDSMDFFSSDEPLQMSLSFDMRRFLKTKSKPEYFDAAVILADSGKEAIEGRIKIKARGKMRRDYCHFPPVMLKFPKNDSSGIPFRGKLKMVLPCMPTTNYEDYVLKEYLIYRMFNHVTPYSLRSRLIKITLIDSNKPDKSYSAYAFLIENEKSLAERNGAVLINNGNLGQRNMNSDDMTRVAVFNYMIGNTDWSVPMQHNIKILKSIQVMADKGIPLVYDFDYAGLVSPPYAAPATELPIKDVKERYYLGLCDNHTELESIIDEFGGLKEKFLATVDDFEYLGEPEKKSIELYINSFYKMYRNPGSMVNMLNRTCK